METWTLEKNTEELRTMDGKLSYNSTEDLHLDPQPLLHPQQKLFEA